MPNPSLTYKPWWKTSYFFAILGILAAIITYQSVPAHEYPHAPILAAIVALMAVWWVFEVIPIPVTSLFPLFLFPAFGIMDMRKVAGFYGKPTIFLFLGGFLLALGLQQSGIHKRIALHIVRRIGSKPANLILGFMIASGILSMWISNTASVMVMLPIALSVLEEAKESGASQKLMVPFGICIMLGIAYAADVGGMATIVGTPPNMVFVEMYSDIFPQAPEIGFVEWMLMGLPITLLFMTIGWVLLTKVIFRFSSERVFGGRSVIEDQLKSLGKTRRDEKLSGLIFLLAALLWMSGSDINLGESTTIPGWRTLLNLPEVSDAAVAIATSVLLFIIPSKDRKGEKLLEWETARKVPWGILLLFGGGFAIAGGFQTSGLSEIIGQLFINLNVDSPVLIVLAVCIVLTFLTELTSNTATTNLVLPILAKAAVVLGFDPRLLMIPATLSASCAFMMPVASPTQAIVFGSGYVSIRQMMRAGIWFNVLGIILVTLIFMLIGQYVLGIDMSTMPDWAVMEQVGE